MVSGHLRVRESLGLLIEESVRKHIGGHQRVALPEGTPLVQLTGALPRRYHRRGIFFCNVHFRPTRSQRQIDCAKRTAVHNRERGHRGRRRLLTELVGLIACRCSERSGRFERHEEHG